MRELAGYNLNAASELDAMVKRCTAGSFARGVQPRVEMFFQTETFENGGSDLKGRSPRWGWRSWSCFPHRDMNKRTII
jgi:hypothetical protein